MSRWGLWGYCDVGGGGAAEIAPGMYMLSGLKWPVVNRYQRSSSRGHLTQNRCSSAYLYLSLNSYCRRRRMVEGKGGWRCTQA